MRVLAAIGRDVRELVSEVRARHLVPWTLAYLAGAWVLLEATTHLAGVYGWPPAPLRALPIILGAGALSAATLAWFHGAAGWQRISARECLVHACVLVLVVTLLGYRAAEEELPVSAVETAGGPLTRVAVVQFRPLSGAAEDTVLGEGLTAEVVHRLASVPALSVIPLVPVVPEGERVTGRHVAEAARPLGAGALVHGSLSRAQDSLRVVVPLVETRTGDHLGSWTVACSVLDDDCTSHTLARHIADSIRVTIGRELARRRAEEGATAAASLASYRRASALIEQAGMAWRESHRAGLALLEEADSLLEAAEQVDPGWSAPAEARMEVADLRSQLQAGPGSRVLEPLAAALAHADRTLALVRDSAPLLERRGRLLLTMAEHGEAADVQWRLAAAERDLRMAAMLDPQRPLAWKALSEIANKGAAFEAAYELAVRAHQADSFGELGVDGLIQLVWMALQVERIEEAGRWCEEALRLQPYDQGALETCLVYLASVPHPGSDEIEKAWTLTATFGLAGVGMAERRPAWTALGQVITAAVLASAGEADSAESVVGRAVPVLRASSPKMHASGLVFEALVRHRLAQPDSAIRLLEGYLHLHPSAAAALARDWWFRDLWEDPRFVALTVIPTESAPGR